MNWTSKLVSLSIPIQSVFIQINIFIVLSHTEEEFSTKFEIWKISKTQEKIEAKFSIEKFELILPCHQKQVKRVLSLLCSLWWFCRDDQPFSHWRNSYYLLLNKFHRCKFWSDILCGSDNKHEKPMKNADFLLFEGD